MSTSRNDRSRYMHALAESAQSGLADLGLGPMRILASLRFMPVRLPEGLWFTEHTQNKDLHVKVTDTTISLRMHIDAFHGERPRNEAAFDLVQDAIETDLARLLPEADLDWRAARGGNNQVLAITGSGGVLAGQPKQDAGWLVRAADALISVLRNHPIGDLRERTMASLNGDGT